MLKRQGLAVRDMVVKTVNGGCSSTAAADASKCNKLQHSEVTVGQLSDCYNQGAKFRRLGFDLLTYEYELQE